MDDPSFDAIAALGEFFALAPADPVSWQPILSLSGDALRDYTGRTQAATAAAFRVEQTLVPVKAAASSLHLSITARLISPMIGAGACGSPIPLLTSDSVFWQPDSTHRPVLGVAGAQWCTPADPTHAAGVIADTLIATVLAPLHEAMRSALGIGPQVMWGNVASAAHGAVTVLTHSRPDAAPWGHRLVDALLTTESLRGTAEMTGRRFRRRSCCLFYQVPGGGYCGDCVLVD